MKILLCSVPDGSLEDTLKPLFPRGNHEWQQPVPPIGIMRIYTWIEKKGYSSDMYDINSLRPSDEELIKNFKRIKPTIVGLGGMLTHCYPNVKRITKILRKLFPDIWIVVGGNLSGSSNVVLQKTETDILIVGEGEIPFVKLLDYFKSYPTRRQIDYAGLSQIKGLAFMDENNKLRVTGNAEQLPATEMLFPDYDKLKLGLQEFGGNGELVKEFFTPVNNISDVYDFLQIQHLNRREKQTSLLTAELYKKMKNKRIGRMQATKGCVARCTFCQRAVKGYRVFPNHDLESHIIELKEKYNVKALLFLDENLGTNRKLTYEMARIIKKHDLFWVLINSRCTNFTYEDLVFYKEHNLISVLFGVESGSQKMLDIMEKKFTTKDVYNAVSLCKKAGVYTNPDVLILGMPGETKKTILKTAEFMASLWHLLEKDWNIYALPYLAMAIPGTPLYEYCQQIGMIGKTLDEEESFLIRTSGSRVVHILNYVNITTSSIQEVHYWIYLFPYAAKKAYVNLIIKNNKSIKNILSQIYELCVKGSINILISEFDRRKNYYKNKKFLQKSKWYINLSTNFLLSLSVLLLPKIVLFPIIRSYANIRFYHLMKKSKSKEEKQKNSLFANRPAELVSDFIITENRIAEADRQKDRSLRTFVMNNRKQMKPAITDEEKGLQILLQGQ